MTDSGIRISCRDRVEGKCSQCSIKSYCPTSLSDSHISYQEVSSRECDDLSTSIHRRENSCLFYSICLEYEIRRVDRPDIVTHPHCIP